MFIKNSQQNIDFKIPDNFFNIGIKISGGADSAIVCYILSVYKVTERPDIEIHPITAINSYKPYQLVHAKKVIEFCEQKFKFKFKPHLTHAPAPEGAELQAAQDKLLIDAYASNTIDCHISGISSNPPENFQSEFFEESLWFERLESRDRTKELKKTQLVNWHNGKCSPTFRPLANLDKRGIAELYQHFDLIETLFPLTKSCEYLKNKWDSPHCGDKCWWCLERRWGFGRII